ncbi:hypothetical protein [aff. Roholtiella sp. LEGE 12411]|uniref:hypothetical protein n=1 Tax=aff. Roholtiella sp. LEGE 12411 TaxID=1828822 RepID=UPI00187DE26D|nr:hypothetical protein [aff. Roholtiella sp. LEGE 12411]MBE9034415.1 hypothetical protein [aff. Roholtiella sp. LEGE 12411]
MTQEIVLDAVCKTCDRFVERAFWDLVLTHRAIAVPMECMKQACGGCAKTFCR